MDIHDRIKARRIELKMSHEQLAKRISDLEGLKKPLAWQTVQQWENKSSAPKRSRLKHVAAALTVPLEELMGFTATTNPIPSPLAAAALRVEEPRETAYRAGTAWPFKFITSEQLSQLPSGQLADLERLIVDHLMNPTNAQWRRLALDLASELDRKNRDDQLTNFVRAVDLKARAIRAAQLQEASTET